jgi:hypothetical protein
MIDGVIRDSSAECEEITSNQTAISQNLGSGRRRNYTLQVEILAAAADGNEKSNKVGDPGPTLYPVQSAVAQDGRDKGHYGHNRDTNADANFLGI